MTLPLQQDTSPNGGPASGAVAPKEASHMSFGVITPPRRHPPELTESVENIPGPSRSQAKDEPVKKGPGATGPGNKSLRRE